MVFNPLESTLRHKNHINLANSHLHHWQTGQFEKSPLKNLHKKTKKDKGQQELKRNKRKDEKNTKLSITTANLPTELENWRKKKFCKNKEENKNVWSERNEILNVDEEERLWLKNKMAYFLPSHFPIRWSHTNFKWILLLCLLEIPL